MITNHISHNNPMKHWFENHRVLIAPESGTMRIRYVTPAGTREYLYEYTRVDGEDGDYSFFHDIKELH